MKSHSPLLDKILFTVSMALVVLFLFFLLGNMLVNAIAPEKPPFFDVMIVGLAGLIVSCIALVVHKWAKGSALLPLWIYLPTVGFLAMAIGGILANTLIR